MSGQNFNEWAFKQCVTKGHEIRATKNELGTNIKFTNTTTKEEFLLDSVSDKSNSISIGE